MKKGLTELVFILDMSGSMGPLRDDTIGGFNTLIEKQREEPGEALVSTVVFNDESAVLHDRAPLERVRPLTRREYRPCGSTALIDAVGGAISHIGNVHKYARSEDVPENTLFVITTDGMENASRRYSLSRVRGMIERQKARYGWEFLFIGANIDAVETAGQFGIGADRSANYCADAQGTEVLFSGIATAVTHHRRGSLTGQWNEEIQQDYQTRSKKQMNDSKISST